MGRPGPADGRGLARQQVVSVFYGDLEGRACENNRRLFVRKQLEATLFLTCCDWLTVIAFNSIHEELRS